MKIIKIILLSVLAITVIALIAAYVAIKNFDLNKHLPEITKAASEAAGRNISIGQGTMSISMEGVHLVVESIAVAGDKPGDKPLLTASQIQAQVYVMPLLLQQKIQSNGIVVTGVHVSVAGEQPVELNVPHIDLKFGTAALDQPFPVTVDAIFASSVKNMHATARVIWKSKEAAADVSDLVFRTDLAQLNMSEIKTITPALAQASLPESMKGVVTVQVPHVVAGAKGVEGLNARVELNGGEVKLKELMSPLSNIKIIADADLNNVAVKEFSLDLSGGKITGEGQVTDYAKTAQLSGQARFNGIAIEGLTDPAALPVVVKGKAQGSVSISGQGLDPKVLMPSLTGSGDVEITEGVVEKLNILKTVLGSAFSVIPGLADALDGMITGALKTKLGADQTQLQKAAAQFTIAQQTVNVNKAVVETPALNGEIVGTAGFDMKINMSAGFLLDQVLSADLVKKVPQMAYLYDADKKHITINGKIAGVVPDVKFAPSIEFKNVAQNAIVEEGGKQLQKVIEKNPEVGSVLNALFGSGQNSAGQGAAAPVEGEQTNAQAEERDPSENSKQILNNVLNGFFKQ